MKSPTPWVLFSITSNPSTQIPALKGRFHFMANILAVGIATIDIINRVNGYPHEDDEIRAISQSIRRGGNATNTLVALSQLGHQCAWSGVLIDESDATIVKQDLDVHQISYRFCKQLSTGKLPASYITVSKPTGSRTIVHYRDCPELDFHFFSQQDLAGFDWIHFEGRNVDELDKMLRWLKTHYPHLPCSLEIEKPREGIEKLFPLADVLLFSKPYVLSQGYDSAELFLQSLSLPSLMTCTWGETGAWLKNHDVLIFSPAFPPNDVIDTLAAGDTFNAGIISGMIKQLTDEETLSFACHLAGKKCGQEGLENLLPL